MRRARVQGRRGRLTILMLATTAALGGAPAGPARAATRVWRNSFSSGNWSTAGNWSDNPANPAAGATGTPLDTDNALIRAGSVTVNMDLNWGALAAAPALYTTP